MFESASEYVVDGFLHATSLVIWGRGSLILPLVLLVTLRGHSGVAWRPRWAKAQSSLLPRTKLLKNCLTKRTLTLAMRAEKSVSFEKSTP